MKNWLSWIVGGTVAASVVTYASSGNPTRDLLNSARSIEEFCSFADVPRDHDESARTDELSEQNVDSEFETKSRLIQQRGNSRFGRESNDGSNRANQRNQYATLKAFRESVGDHWKSTVQILEKNRQIALGATVSIDGWIVTKSSEVPDGKIDVRLFDGSKAEGMVKTRRTDLDLALIKIERIGLPVIAWDTRVEVPVGGWLISSDNRNLPVAIGVLSVSSRNVPRERAVLGVTLGEPPASERGALVEGVIEGSGADRAGVRTGDVIHRINGDALITRKEVLDRLGGLAAGQRVDVGIQREGTTESLTAQMMDLNHALLDPTEMEVNGEISARATGFQKVIQHDSVLAPNQCGGPVIDIHGNVVGINIARAGRVSSYAIPAKTLAPAIADMLSSAIGNPSSNNSNVVQASRQAPPTNAFGLPTSVPAGISIEALKPEVVGPNAVLRP